MDLTKYEDGAAASPPTAPDSPSAGYPTDGNPQTATPATVLGAYWFHQLSAELGALLTTAGLTRDYDALDQLSAAVRRISGTQATEITADKTLTIADAGLITVDASAGDVTLTLPAASALAGLSYRFARVDSSAHTVTIAAVGSDTIEGSASATVASGDRVTVVADGSVAWQALWGTQTPGVALSQFASNIASGWRKIPDADSPSGFFIEQWGQETLTLNQVKSIVFPVSFPNACVSRRSEIYHDTIESGLMAPYTGSATTNGMDLILDYSTGTAAGNYTVAWEALGY